MHTAFFISHTYVVSEESTQQNHHIHLNRTQQSPNKPECEPGLSTLMVRWLSYARMEVWSSLYVSTGVNKSSGSNPGCEHGIVSSISSISLMYASCRTMLRWTCCWWSSSIQVKISSSHGSIPCWMSVTYEGSETSSVGLKGCDDGWSFIIFSSSSIIKFVRSKHSSLQTQWPGFLLQFCFSVFWNRPS